MAELDHPLSPDAMAAWRAFLEVGALMMPRVEAQLVEAGGVTSPQYGVLLALQAAPQGLTMTQVAHDMVVSKSGLTYQVDRLIDLGLVTRAVDPDDERRRVVRITRDGIDAIAAVKDGHVELLRATFFAAVTDDDVADLARSLHRILRHLRSLDGE